MFVRKLPLWTVALCFSLTISGCGGGGGGSDSSDGEETEPRSELAPDFVSDCGVVQNALVVNPINSGVGEAVTIVSVVDSTHLIVQRAQGPQLIQLHGVLPPESGEPLARTTLNQLAAEPAVLFEVGASCPITGPGGSVGIAGDLFTASGKSYIEEIIKAGVALTLQPDGVCFAGLRTACFTGLEDTYRPRTMGEITDFLWKPAADSSYNPGSMVIHAGPCNATVSVNGQVLRDYGPGNGRCNTSRAFQPGCAFGTNVKVEIVDNDTGLPYTHNGEPFVTVPNGCNRFEFRL